MLRSLAHLEEQLGSWRFTVLTDPTNTGRVRALCDQILEEILPTTITVGGRTYEVISFSKGSETIDGCVMGERAKRMQANLGEEEGRYFLAHQEDIPRVFCNKVAFVFPAWRNHDNPKGIANARWDEDHWRHYWYWSKAKWDGFYRLLRRV